MKYGIHLAGRVSTTSAKADSPDRVSATVDDLTDGSALIVHEYIYFLGAGPDPDLIRPLDADDELTALTMSDEWYLQKGHELDLDLVLGSASSRPWRTSPDGSHSSMPLRSTTGT